MTYEHLYTFVPTGDWENDIKSFLVQYNHLFTYEHSVRVANEARKIAKRFQVNEEQAVIAGYLHDISAIFPNNERIAVVIWNRNITRRASISNDYSSKNIEGNSKRNL